MGQHEHLERGAPRCYPVEARLPSNSCPEADRKDQVGLSAANLSRGARQSTRPIAGPVTVGLDVRGEGLIRFQPTAYDEPELRAEFAARGRCWQACSSELRL